MKKMLKEKTFLYYFEVDNIIWSISPYLKLAMYVILNLFVLVNTNYIVNIGLSFIAMGLLFFMGFFVYRRSLLKLLVISLLLSFLISLTMNVINISDMSFSYNCFKDSFLSVLPFFSKWMLINTSGLLLFTIFSQNELINLLESLKINYKFLISITLAFNMIGRMLESLDDIEVSLLSRGLKVGRKMNVFRKISYIFVALILDNIELISSLRATYAFDREELERRYEK